MDASNEITTILDKDPTDDSESIVKLLFSTLNQQLSNLYGSAIGQLAEKEMHSRWSGKLFQFEDYVKRAMENEEDYGTADLLNLRDDILRDFIKTNDKAICRKTLAENWDVEATADENMHNLGLMVGDLLGAEKGRTFYYLLKEYIYWGSDPHSTNMYNIHVVH